MATHMALEEETRLYEQHRDTWVADGRAGQWVVIAGDWVVGFYPSLDVAYAVARGLNRPEHSEILVEQVTPTEQIETIQRVDWGTGDDRERA